jgi:hypothetical protein
MNHENAANQFGEKAAVPIRIWTALCDMETLDAGG